MDGFRSGMYCIVNFAGGRKSTVVPDTWLSINDTLCLLPPNATDSDVEVLVRNLAEPGEGWQMLDVRSLQTFESYSEAKRQLDRSVKTSQSEASISLRRRKKPSYPEDYSTRDSDDSRKPYSVVVDFDEDTISENEWIPPREFNPRIENVSTVREAIHNDRRPRNHRFSDNRFKPRNHRFRQTPVSSLKENIDIMCDCQSSCHRTFLQALHDMQEQLDRENQIAQKQLDRNDQIVHQLLGAQKQTHSMLKRVFQRLPVNQKDGQEEEMDVFSQDDTNSIQSIKNTSSLKMGSMKRNNEFLRRQVDRDIEAKVEEHMREISRAAPVDGSLNTTHPIKDKPDSARRRSKKAGETSDVDTSDQESGLEKKKREKRGGAVENSVLPPLNNADEVSTSLPTVAPKIQPSASNELFQRKLFRMCEELKAGQEEILNMLAASKNSNVAQLPLDSPKLPVNTPEDLQAYDQYLEEKLLFSQTCTHFGMIGGPTYSNAIRRMLSMILTNNLAQMYNWRGGGGNKLAFCHYKNVLKLLTTSIRRHQSFEKVTDQEVEVAVKKWLINSVDRDGGRSLRKKRRIGERTVEGVRENNVMAEF